MIKLAPSPIFTLKLVLRPPGESKGHPFELTCRHLGRARLAEWSARAMAAGADDLASLLEVVTGWKGVADADGVEAPFTPEAFGALLDAYPGAALMIFGDYLRELSEARVKN